MRNYRYYIFSVFLMIQSITEDKTKPSLGPDALEIYVTESRKGFEIRSTAVSKNFENLNNLLKSFENLIKKMEDLVGAGNNVRCPEFINSYMNPNSTEDYQNKSDAVIEAENNLMIILDIYFRWWTNDDVGLRGIPTCFFARNGSLQDIPDCKPNNIKLADGFSWDQVLEWRDKYVEAISYRKDEDAEENKEAKEGYFKAKQEYNNAFYCFDIARKDFYDKFFQIENCVDDKSIEFMKLNEYDELKNLCLIDSTPFKHYKNLWVIYAFAFYFVKKLFPKNSQLRILLLKNNIGKILEQSRALIDHLTKNKPLKVIDFPLFKEMICCNMPQPCKGEPYTLRNRGIIKQIQKAKDFYEISVELIKARKDFEKIINAYFDLMRIDFCILFFNIMTEKRGINGIDINSAFS